MCGRFVIDASLETLVTWFAAMTDLTQWSPTWNAAPTHMLPVVLGGQRGRRLGLMRWGWERSFKKGVICNAIGEEAAAKKTFAAALNSRRCLVPATAFYEWRESDGQPFAYRHPHGEVFAIAGIWEKPPEPNGAAFVIFTVPANAVVEPAHHRMAATIERDDWDQWLDPWKPTSQVAHLLRPSTPEAWEAVPVGRAVNSVRNNDSTLMERVSTA